MKKFILVALSLFFAVGLSHAGIELGALTEVDVGGKPLAVTASANGERIYILTDNGKVATLTAKGKLEGSVDVGKGFTRITTVAGSEKLILTNPNTSTVKIVTLEVIFDIDLSGSPYQGKESAPVAVVSFMDFQ